MAVADEILIEKVRRGEKGAFGVLVERYQHKVYNTALKILGAPEDARDATQETFIRAYRKINDFKGEARFSTWLYKMAANCCLDMLRAGKKERSNLSLDDSRFTREMLVDSQSGPEDLAAEHEDRDTIRRAVANLPDHYRLALVLHHYQGLSYKEVASVLGISINTVATHIARAKQSLREELLGGEQRAVRKGKGKAGQVPRRGMSAF